jgi:hypothetical protein
MANTTIQIRKSGATGNTPSDLEHGELAINYADGKLFYKDDADLISYISNQDTFATINANSTLILATSTSDVLGVQPGNNITIVGDSIGKKLTISIVDSPSFNGSVTFGNTSSLTSVTYVTSSLSEVSVDFFQASQFRSAKYYVQLTSGTKHHVIELRVLHDGTTVYMIQYGEMYTNDSLGVFDAQITGGFLYLLFTPTNSVTTVKLTRNTITT